MKLIEIFDFRQRNKTARTSRAAREAHVSRGQRRGREDRGERIESRTFRDSSAGNPYVEFPGGFYRGVRLPEFHR